MEFSALIKRFSLAEKAPAASSVTPTKAEEPTGQMSLEDALFPAAPTVAAAPVTAEKTTAAQLAAIPVDTPLAVALQEDMLTVYDGTRLLCCEIAASPADAEHFFQARTRLICYDSKALYHALEDRGIHLRSCYFDVMLAAYVVNAGESGFDLERLALSYLQELTDGEGDTSAPLIFRLWQLRDAALTKTEQAHLFYDVEMPLSAVLCDMEREGSALDCKGLLAYGEQLELLASDGMLVKRPLLVLEDQVLVGFRQTQWEETLGRK
jgi:DNA polymerase I-like protein with 3'-5' exonuclease and polymerase domains